MGLFHQPDIPISLAFLRRFPTEAKAAWLSELRLGPLAHGQREP
jgi:hypothetical protein